MTVVKPMRILFIAALLCSPVFNADAQKSVYLSQYKTPKNSLPLIGYYQIGGYRVKGNPYYKEDFILGDIYSATEIAKGIYLRYDIYNQKAEFISSSNPDEILVKEPGDLDSFLLYKNGKNKVIVEDIKFVYATTIGASGKAYYSSLFNGTKYSLFKKYVSELVVPLDPTGRPDSRVFENRVEYWYRNESTKEFKKVNASVAAVKKEFAEVKDLSEVLKGGNMFSKPDEAMIKAFTYLNE
jgi:hypothetical protein